MNLPGDNLGLDGPHLQGSANVRIVFLFAGNIEQDMIASDLDHRRRENEISKPSRSRECALSATFAGQSKLFEFSGSRWLQRQEKSAPRLFEGLPGRTSKSLLLHCLLQG